MFGIQGAALRKRTDDPSTATVRFELRAVSREPSLTVSATVPGKSGARASAPWSEVESAFVADLQLQRKPAGTLVVSIRPPADGRFSWELRRLDGPRAPELLQGSTFWGAQSEPRTGPPDRPTFGGLKPGRYQFVADCGLATEPIEFGEAPSTREVSLDLSRVQVVSGRFEAPDGVDLTGAHVVIEGDGLVSAAKGTLGIGAPRGARHGGEFRVRVPGDRPVRLRAAHPSLVAAATGGTVEVEGAAEGVVLRLVEGAHAVLRLDPTTPPTAEGLRLRPQILLYSGDPSGEPVSIHVAEGDDPYRFEGFAPGTWTLVVDAHGLAPGVLRGVSLGPGRTDLGTIHLEEGACVRLNPKLGAGAVAPSLHVLAWPLGGPRHSRFLNYHGKGDLILRGLAKGPYRLTVAPSGSPSTLLLERRIDSEGTGEILVDLDLR